MTLAMKQTGPRGMLRRREGNGREKRGEFGWAKQGDWVSWRSEEQESVGDMAGRGKE